jgi:ankyrin repeat protein
VPQPAPPDSLGLWLVEAVHEGDAQRVRALLAAGAFPEGASPDTARDGQSLAKYALHYAAQYGRAEVAHLLLDAGADVAAATVQGMPPLGYAALFGHPGVARVLLEAGVDVHTPVYAGSSALMMAAGDAYDPEHHTPGRGFNAGGHLDVFRLLHEAGADLFAVKEVGGTLREPYTVLHAAAFSGRMEILHYVVQADTAGRLLREHGVSALEYAAVADRTDAMRYLFDLGVEPDVTRLGEMLTLTGLWGRASAARLLLRTGAPANYRRSFTARRDPGQTALILAVRGGYLETVRVLLDGGASPTLVDSDGDTPLEIARRYGHPEAARLLRAAIDR